MTNALIALGTCLLGFLALALATERQAELLLGRLPAPPLRRALRGAGWLLLAAALTLCWRGWGSGIGAVLWTGSLGMAGVVLVFGMPWWASRAERPSASAPPWPQALVHPRRPWLRWLLLLAAPLAFVAALQAVPVKPVLRADAIEGGVGPWTFRLAETDHLPPKLVGGEIPLKQYDVRFCDACDAQIRSAYLKVNKPRSLRGAGIVFNGSRWDRRVEIQLPSKATADSQLWLTVEGMDGALHQVSWRLQEVSPATVAWFSTRQGD